MISILDYIKGGQASLEAEHTKLQSILTCKPERPHPTNKETVCPHITEKA